MADMASEAFYESYRKEMALYELNREVDARKIKEQEEKIKQLEEEVKEYKKKDLTSRILTHVSSDYKDRAREIIEGLFD